MKLVLWIFLMRYFLILLIFLILTLMYLMRFLWLRMRKICLRRKWFVVMLIQWLVIIILLLEEKRLLIVIGMPPTSQLVRCVIYLLSWWMIRWLQFIWRVIGYSLEKKMVIIVVMILLLLLRVMFYLLEDCIKVVRLLFFRLWILSIKLLLLMSFQKIWYLVK